MENCETVLLHRYESIYSEENRPEEQDLLDTIIENLREYHADAFEFTDTEDGDLIIRLKLTGDVYKKSDYYDHQPLVLVKKMVQEDFMLVKKGQDGMWTYIGGVATFSFTDMGLRGERGFMKPGNHIHKIHAPVPNFQDKLYPTVNHIFNL